MIKSFNEFFNERSSIHTFLDWVVKEGVHLPEHLMEQETIAHAHQMFLEVDDEDDWFDIRTPKEKAADKLQQTIKQTKPMSGQGFKFAPKKGNEDGYTGQSQNFYNTAVSSIQGLIGRQPQLAPQLANILNTLKQTFTSKFQPQMPDQATWTKKRQAQQQKIGRRAATAVPGAAAPGAGVQNQIDKSIEFHRRHEEINRKKVNNTL